MDGATGGMSSLKTCSPQGLTWEEGLAVNPFYGRTWGGGAAAALSRSSQVVWGLPEPAAGRASPGLLSRAGRELCRPTLTSGDGLEPAQIRLAPTTYQVADSALVGPGGSWQAPVRERSRPLLPECCCRAAAGPW